MQSPGLPLTGERTVPGVPAENYWFRRHEAAYEFVLGQGPRGLGGRILEVGCGEGYGSALLAAAPNAVPDAVSNAAPNASANTVIGIDYDVLTIAHAARTYPQVCFLRANLAALPVTTGAVDAVAALQVIEHVWDHTGFLAECRRVLRPGGLLFVTTPNRLTFSPGLDAPVNPFHTKEFTGPELARLLGGCGFTVEPLYGLHPSARLAGLDAGYGGSFVGAQLAEDPQLWNDRLRDDVATVTTSDFAVLADIDRDVDSALDLVAVARRA